MYYQKQRGRHKKGAICGGVRHSRSWRIEGIQAYLNDLRLRHAELRVNVVRLAQVDACRLGSMCVQGGLRDAVERLGLEVERFDLSREPRCLLETLAS